MRCAGYIRVSTDKEEQKTSIENQRNIFINYIKEKSWTLHDFYIDIQTGTTGKRENLQRLIEDAKLKKFDVIIAKELSRLARNGSLSYQIRDIALQNQISIVTLDGAINSVNGDTSKYGLYTWLYEEESQRTSDRVKSSLKERAAKGLFKGSVPPYGYYCQNGSLFLRDDGAPQIVEWIFEQYISGRGFDSMARELFVKDVPSPAMLTNRKNANSKWHGSSVRNILENPHYVGKLVQQRDTTASVTNKMRVKNPKDKIVVVEHTHEPIVSEETFALVQDLIKSRAKKRHPVSKHLFSGIITCNDCNAAMHYKYNRKGYICGSYVKLTKKACTHHAIKETCLVQAILQDVDECLKLLSGSDTQNQLTEMNQKEVIRLSKRLSSLKDKIESIHKRKSKLLTLLVEDTISKSDYQTAVSMLDEEINLIKAEELDVSQLLDLKKHTDDTAALKILLNSVSSEADITNLTISKLIKHVRVKEDGTPLIEYRFDVLNYLKDIFPAKP